MKIKIIAVAIVAIAATTLQAQDKAVAPATTAPVQKETMAQKQPDLATRLGLNENQAQAMKQLDHHFNGEIKQLQGQTTDPAELKSKSAELNRQYENRLRSLFTPEQYEKWEAYKKEKREQSATKEAEMQKAIGK